MEDKEIKKSEELQNDQEQVLSDEELSQVTGGGMRRVDNPYITSM